ncbi:MAG: hypothetical protein U0936_25820 [Planctomycetaceae bacterium]
MTPVENSRLSVVTSENFSCRYKKSMSSGDLTTVLPEALIANSSEIGLDNTGNARMPHLQVRSQLFAPADHCRYRPDENSNPIKKAIPLSVATKANLFLEQFHNRLLALGKFHWKAIANS